MSLRFGLLYSLLYVFFSYVNFFSNLSLSLFLYTAVKSIKKQQLVEIRTMANPPAVVKLALESICLLLGENASDWKSIRAVIMRDNFINTVVNNFNTEDIRYACGFWCFSFYYFRIYFENIWYRMIYHRTFLFHVF